MNRIAWCLLVAAMAVRAETPAGLFPDIHPTASGAPPEIVLQREFTASDEQPKDARNVISNATVRNPENLPLGPNSRVIGTFEARPGKGPAKLVLDWAGFEVAKPEPGSRDATVVVNVFFACEGTRDYCGSRDPARPAESQKLFFLPSGRDAEEAMREAVVDGKPRRVHVEHGVLANEIPPGRAITLHVAFNSPAHVQTYRLRTTLLYGDFGTAAPVRPRVLPGWIRIVAIAALVLLAVSWWRRGRSEEPFDSDEPPKVLGMLVRVLGLIWAIAGIAFFDAYSMGLGLLLAIAGGDLYYGRSRAVAVMWILVGVAWTWSIREVGTDVRQLLPRVGLITILWLWVIFGGTASRLGTRGEAYERPDT